MVYMVDHLYICLQCRNSQWVGNKRMSNVDYRIIKLEITKPIAACNTHDRLYTSHQLYWLLIYDKKFDFSKNMGD